jgi:hypothetical protein
MSYEVTYLQPHFGDWYSLKSNNEEENEANNIRQNKEKLKQQLLSAMQMQNIIVLAGSGTSLGDVNGPSMMDLWNHCTKKDDSYTDEAKKIAEKIDYDLLNEEHVNIEEFLSLCEAYIQIKNDEEVSNYVKHCKECILRKCSFEKTNESLNGHKTLVHRLSRRRVRDSRLKLFTTNYDTCFEEAASNQGIVIIDGFSFTKPRRYDPRFFDFDIVRRTPNCIASDTYLEGVFQLFKLHGSVYWEREGSYIIEKQASPEGACMIFPAKGKYQQSYIQPHLELMARYLAALREPNTCLIIAGFGFNDDHLSEPIISAIQSNPYLKVIIADHSAKKNIEGENEHASPYWSILDNLHKKGEDLMFINASFQDFANLIPDLRSLSPAEKIAQAITNLTGEHQ